MTASGLEVGESYVVCTVLLDLEAEYTKNGHFKNGVVILGERELWRWRQQYAASTGMENEYGRFVGGESVSAGGQIGESGFFDVLE